MPNYVSNAANARAVQQNLVDTIQSPADVIGLVRVPAHLVGLDVAASVKKAVIDYEVEQLRAALYTFNQVTP